MTKTTKPANIGTNTAENKTANKAANNKNTTANKQTPPKSQPPINKKQKTTNGGKGLSVAAIILALLIGGGLFYYGQQEVQKQNTIIADLQAKLSQTNTHLQQNLTSVAEQTTQAITSSNQELKTGLAQNHTVISQQSADIQSLQKIVNELRGRTPNDWMITEADYLSKMAGRKLWLEHDVPSAIQLLKAADVRIAELNDPSLTPIRKALSSDLTQLSALPRVDRDGFVLQISSLEQQIKSLPIDSALLPKAELETKTEVSSSLDNWKENALASLKKFGENFITYRKRDGSVIPQLSPVQHFYVQENIKSKLETAIQAVYREQPVLYKAALKQAIDWTLEFFNKEDSSVQSFVATLQKLEAQNIEINYPDKLKSPTLITQLIEERLRNKIISINNSGDK